MSPRQRGGLILAIANVLSWVIFVALGVWFFYTLCAELAGH